MRNSLFSLFILGCFVGLISCNQNTFDQGKGLYSRYCSDCHMEDGTGLRGLIPPLAGADHLKNFNLNTVCYIIDGLKDSIIVNGKHYEQEMLPIKGLEAAEITNIMNYINQSWGNNYGFVNYTEVEKQIKACKSD